MQDCKQEVTKVAFLVKVAANLPTVSSYLKAERKKKRSKVYFTMPAAPALKNGGGGVGVSLHS